MLYLSVCVRVAILGICYWCEHVSLQYMQLQREKYRKENQYIYFTMLFYHGKTYNL